MNIILWLSLSAWADPAPGLSLADLKTKLHKYQELSQLEVDFVQIKYFKSMQIDLTSKGHLSVRPPDLVIWELKEPTQMKVIMDKGSIEIERPNSTDNYATSDIPPEQRQELATLINWLKMDLTRIHQDYKVTGRRNQLRFDAKKKSLFERIDLTLKSSGEVEKMVFKEKSGDEMHWLFQAPLKIIRREHF